MRTVDCEFKIAKMEDGHNELTCLSNMLLGEADGFEGNFELLKLVCVIVSDAVWAGTSTALAEVSVLHFFPVNEGAVSPLVKRLQ